MFVKNKSVFSPVLARGNVHENVGVASIGLELVFDILDDGSLRLCDDDTRSETDPPDIRRTLLWRGTSVTAFGHVHGPQRGPHAAGVRVSVGDHHVDLAVYGDRRWERTAWGGWMQTEPQPFDGIPMSWSRAFGGTVHLEPGYFPGTELPHPGGDIAYPLNREGVGYVLDRETAHGQALPNIENPSALMAVPTDTPTPVGAAPCPRHAGLRPQGAHDPSDLASVLNASLLQQHHAPTPLLFTHPVVTGTPIETHNIGATSLSFSVPPCPIIVTLHRGSRAVPTRERLRSVHVDGDKRRARLSWALFERYEAQRPPRFAHVEAA